MENRDIKRSGALLIIITIIEKLLGFGRDMVIASQFGATWLTDSYIAGYLIPNFIMVLLNAGLINVYAPMFISEMYIDQDAAWQKISSVSTYLMAIVLVLTGLGILFCPNIVRILYPRFDNNQMEASILISRLFFIGVFIYSAVIIMGSILNSLKYFIFMPVSITFLSLGIISSVILFGRNSNINSIAYGYQLGAIAGLIISYSKLKKIGGKLKINFKLYGTFNQRFLRLLFPILVSTSMSQFNVFVDKIFASYLPDGSMSYLTYGDRLTEVPIFLFSGIISTVIFPDMIHYMNNNNIEKLKAYFNKSIVAALLFLVPSTVGLVMLREEIVSLLFERNMFDRAAAESTASVFLYYSPTILSYGIMGIISKVYYSMKDTRTLMHISIWSIFLNAALDYLFLKPMLFKGLALATSIVGIMQLFAAFYFLNRKINLSAWAYLNKNISKIIISSIFMGTVLYILKAYFSIQYLPGFVILAVTVGIVVYIVSIIILNVDGVDIIINKFRKNKVA